MWRGGVVEEGVYAVGVRANELDGQRSDQDQVAAVDEPYRAGYSHGTRE